MGRLFFIVCFQIITSWNQLSANTMRYFEGSFEKNIPIQVVLNVTQDSVFGEIAFVNSVEKYQLKGTLKKGQLSVNEISQEGMDVGSIEGTIAPGTFELIWNSTDNKRGHYLFLKEVDNFDKLPPLCSTGVFYKNVSCRIKGNLMNFYFKINKDQLNGNCFFQSNSNTYSVTGFFKNGLWELRFFSKVGKEIGTGTTTKFNNLQFKPLNGKPELINLFNPISYIIDCSGKVTYSSYYDYEYVLNTNNKEFNKWMQDKTAKLIKTLKDEVAVLESKTSKDLPHNHFVHHGYVDIYPVYFDNLVFSAKVDVFKNWYNKADFSVINYSMELKKEILLKDIYKSKYKKFVKNSIIKLSEKTDLWKDTKYRSWIKSQMFTSFLFNANGLVFLTNENSIYGTQEFEFSFKDLEKYVKKGSILDRKQS